MTGFFVFVWIPLVALSIASMVRGDARWRRRLDAWAAREGYELERVAARWVWIPFLRSGSQRVYSIRVVGRDGVRRIAVARVGDFFVGPRSDRVDVRWDR